MTKETAYMPLVSIIITNYNYGRYLNEAIEGVLNQTYENFELIIVDDGSTDNSRDIINDYSQKNSVRISFVFKENGGQADAFNTGFARSKGEIISFLDSDDYWVPERLEKIVRAFTDNKYSIVQHNMEYTDENSRSMGKLYRKDFFTGDARRPLIDHCHLDFFVPTSGVCFRRSALAEIFPIPETWKICADAAITRTALFYGQLYSFTEPLGFYRIHGNNNWMFTEQQKKTDIVLPIIETINAHLKEKGFVERLEIKKNPLYRTRLLKDRPGLLEPLMIIKAAVVSNFLPPDVKKRLVMRMVKVLCERCISSGWKSIHTIMTINRSLLRKILGKIRVQYQKNKNSLWKIPFWGVAEAKLKVIFKKNNDKNFKVVLCKLCGGNTRQEKAYDRLFNICYNCGFIFASDYSIEEANKGMGLEGSWAGPGGGGYREYYLAKMLNNDLDKEHVLLFGTGNTNTFDKLLKEKLSIVGSDISWDVIDYKKKIYGDDVKFYHPNYIPPDLSFDLIIAVEVIEHFIDPLTSFSFLISKLNNGGIICGTTNFYFGEGVENDGQQNYMKSLGHVAYWSEKSLKYIADKHNLTILLFEMVRPGSVSPDEKFGILWPNKRVFFIFPKKYESYFTELKENNPILPIDNP